MRRAKSEIPSSSFSKETRSNRRTSQTIYATCRKKNTRIRRGREKKKGLAAVWWKSLPGAHSQPWTQEAEGWEGDNFKSKHHQAYVDLAPSICRARRTTKTADVQQTHRQGNDLNPPPPSAWNSLPTNIYIQPHPSCCVKMWAKRLSENDKVTSVRHLVSPGKRKPCRGEQKGEAQNANRKKKKKHIDLISTLIALFAWCALDHLPVSSYYTTFIS